MRTERTRRNQQEEGEAEEEEEGQATTYLLTYKDTYLLPCLRFVVHVFFYIKTIREYPFCKKKRACIYYIHTDLAYILTRVYYIHTYLHT